MFSTIGAIAGGSYGYYLMDEKAGKLILELEAELYFQSFKKHEDIYKNLEASNMQLAIKLLKHRMQYEFTVLDNCVQNNCVKYRVSDLTPEWIAVNRSNKSLKKDAQ